MGLDFMISAIARPASTEPDWFAMRLAAAELPDPILQRVKSWWGPDEDDIVDSLEAARALVMDGLAMLLSRLSSGSRWMTVVENAGWRFYLDGGVSAGDIPHDGWNETVTVAETGLLGAALSWFSDTLDEPPVWTQPPAGPASEFIGMAPIFEVSRIFTLVIPITVDWSEVCEPLAEDQQEALRLIKDAIAGRYSRVLATVVHEDTKLLLVDRAFQPLFDNVASIAPLLERAGFIVLSDARLMRPDDLQED